APRTSRIAAPASRRDKTSPSGSMAGPRAGTFAPGPCQGTDGSAAAPAAASRLSPDPEPVTSIANHSPAPARAYELSFPRAPRTYRFFPQNPRGIAAHRAGSSGAYPPKPQQTGPAKNRLPQPSSWQPPPSTL